MTLKKTADKAKKERLLKRYYTAARELYGDADLDFGGDYEDLHPGAVTLADNDGAYVRCYRWIDRDTLLEHEEFARSEKRRRSLQEANNRSFV